MTAFRLGAAVDTEYTGVPTITALGDDAAGSDDEDGVIFVPPTGCARVTLQFTVTVTGGSGTLGVWFDWNQDRDWDPAEGMTQLVVPGMNVVTVVCPQDFNNRDVLCPTPRVRGAWLSLWGRFTLAGQVGMGSCLC